MPTEWYTCRKGEQQKGPFSSAQLKKLAASGQLGPKDLVWKQGMKDWAESQLFRGLCFQQVADRQDASQASADNQTVPAESSVPNFSEVSGSTPVSQQVDLAMIPCRVCHKSIAASAETCPACGAPNDWLHPEIQRFTLSLQKFNFLPEGSRVYWKGYRVWGTGFKKNPAFDKHPSNWGVKLMIAGMLAGVAGSIKVHFAIIGGILFAVGGIASLIGLLSAAPPREVNVSFSLNFSCTPPRWTCDDREYWAEVRRFFKVRWKK